MYSAAQLLVSAFSMTLDFVYLKSIFWGYVNIQLDVSLQLRSHINRFLLAKNEWRVRFRSPFMVNQFYGKTERLGRDVNNFLACVKQRRSILAPYRHYFRRPFMCWRSGRKLSIRVNFCFCFCLKVFKVNKWRLVFKLSPKYIFLPPIFERRKIVFRIL